MMNKKELLDKAVEQFDGKWPAYCDDNIYMSHRPEIENTRYYPFYVTDYKAEDYVCWRMSEFQQRAKELGYVNGYRYGVEYELDGKGPDLPDDTLIVWTDSVRSAETTCHGMNWVGVESFRITDPRYKPEDTSYLIERGIEICEEIEEKLKNVDETLFNQTDSGEWYCYETQKALRLPPVGVECEVRYARLTDWYKALVLDNDTFAYYQNDRWEVMDLSSKIQFRPLDWDRESADRYKVIDAAFAVLTEFNTADQVLNELYDAGCLVMPSKSSQD